MTRRVELAFVEEREGVAIARLAGELDLSNTADVADALVAGMPPERLGLVIDMGEVTHIDSSGVRALFELRRRLDRNRQRVAVAVPADARIREILELTAVDAMLPVASSVDEALAAIRRRGEPGAG